MSDRAVIRLPLLCLYVSLWGMYHSFASGTVCAQLQTVWAGMEVVRNLERGRWACMLMRGCGACVLTTGHLQRPSAPTKLPLGVGVLTMFWTISSNKSQPKLLVSVSVAKWQTVHPPKASAQNRQGQLKNYRLIFAGRWCTLATHWAGRIWKVCSHIYNPLIGLSFKM